MAARCKLPLPSALACPVKIEIAPNKSGPPFLLLFCVCHEGGREEKQGFPDPGAQLLCLLPPLLFPFTLRVLNHDAFCTWRCHSLMPSNV
jgi:hypothetical protein